jgi:hypothetical protein
MPKTAAYGNVRRKIQWAKVEPIVNPCPVCVGMGSEWKRRADGDFDRRYRWPLGPCPACNGTRVKL